MDRKVGTVPMIFLTLWAVFVVQVSTRSHRRNTDNVKALSHKLASHKTFDNTEFNEILKRHIQKGTPEILPRQGEVSTTSSCSEVRDLPESLKNILPSKAKKYYDKYTEAYGIPVLSHGSVPDAALKRACYVLRFLLADRKDIREAFYSKWGRLVVLGNDEFVHDIPEYQFLRSFLDHDNVANLKGIPANDIIPTTIATEENILCYERTRKFEHRINPASNLQSLISNNNSAKRQQHQHHQKSGRHQSSNSQHRVSPSSDHVGRNHTRQLGTYEGNIIPSPRSMSDDILLKSLAIGILNLAVVTVNPGFKQRLNRAYHHAMASGWWADTESTLGPESYFGEGVQSFYDVNAYSNPPDGFSNDINIRTKLRSYDTALYSIIQEVFPCANSYLKRCNSRGNEAHLIIDMECPIPHWQ